jgi:NADPH:quinone reductase-like Zn-dependent oxidoreductase
MVRDLGADVVIDYKAGPFEDQIDEPMDVVFDVLPFRYEAASQDPRVLRPNGHYIHVASSDMKLKPGDPGTDRLGMAIPEARLSYMAGLWWRWLKRWARRWCKERERGGVAEELLC